jgi:CRISPR type IV-associated DEAD/DEAH-box helicase Csf4
MPSLRVRIPDPLRLLLEQRAGSLAAAVKAVVAEALALRPDPLDPPPPSLAATSHVINISDAQLSALAALGSPRGWDVPLVASALAWSHLQPQLQAQAPALAPQPLSAAMSAVNLAMHQEDRPEQVQYFAALERFALRHEPGVLFAEGGTGIGKTRAYLATVLRWCAEHGEGLAVVAAPTYRVIGQIWREWQRLADAGPTPPAVVVIGQSGFVSQQALDRWLDSREADDPLAAMALAWRRGGAKAAAGALCPSMWTCEGLVAACGGGFPDLDEVLLVERDDDTDLALAAYEAQRRLTQAAASGARLVLVTHAMLAILVRQASRDVRASLDADDQRRLGERVEAWKALSPEDRSGRLLSVVNAALAEFGEPAALQAHRIGLLVVDEAQELERWFSQVSSLQTSVWRIVDELKALRAEFPRVPLRCVTAAETAFAGLRALYGHDDAASVGRAEVATLSDAIDEALRGVPSGQRQSARARRLGAVRLMLDAALRPGNLALRVPAAMRLRIDWSEGRHWPRLVIGYRDVGRQLDFLWRNVAAKAILASATLYEDMPQVSCESMRIVLAVPRDRMVVMAPVRPRWLFDAVTLYLAALTYRGDGLPRFVRPRRPDDERDAKAVAQYQAGYEAWVSDVAQYIGQAWRSGAGGALVLLTSYADLTALFDAVAASTAPLPGPLLRQSEGRPLQCVCEEFMAGARTHRPLMFAVGAAWTGMDLWDPAIPDALTDLIVPVAPFGTMRSVTQSEREQRSAAAATFAAALMLRQGTGRLVRSPRTRPNRRLHFLDARRVAVASAGMFAAINRWLAKYPRQVVV